MKSFIPVTTLAISLFVAVSSLAGGYYLITTNGAGMFSSWLSGSLFSSFFWPGMILSVIVGGTHALAFWKTLQKNKKKEYYTATAAFGLLIWIFTQMYIIKQAHWLQILYFFFAISMLVLTMFSLKNEKRG